MSEQEITNNKIQKILNILSGELSTALILADGDARFLQDVENDRFLEELTRKYQEMEFKEILPQHTNGFLAFSNAIKISRQLLTILRIPNTINSELLRERTTYYINGLYVAYKEEKRMAIDPKKMNYHLMLLFSEQCIQDEWVALETYRREAETKCHSPKRMCEYIENQYKNRKVKCDQREVKTFQKKDKIF